MRRWLIVGVVVGGWVVMTAGSARGDALQDYLDRVAEAEFSGREVVTCSVGGQTASGTYDIVQSAGMTMIHSGDDGAMLGGGKIGYDDAWSRDLVGRWATWRLSDRYRMADPEPTYFMGRPAVKLEILEEGRVRSRVLLDVETGAPLLSEVFSGPSVYCTAAMIELSPGGEMPDMSEPTEGYAMVSPGPASALPDVAGGYWRADTYATRDRMVHSYFTDGLFSFSVFEAGATARAGALDKGAKFKVGHLTYRRLLFPGEMRVLWRTPDHTFVLVGDLPPDHLAGVLAELPGPSKANLFTRLWRRIFG